MDRKTGSRTDANPEELAWFDGLRKDYPFPLDWKGGTWLNARLAEHPAILRHFMSASDEFVALVRELDRERDALLEPLGSGRSRIEDLARRIDEASPFYRLRLTLDGGEIAAIGLSPKYRGAEDDSPLTITFRVATTSDESDAPLREALQAMVDWGDPLIIPASHIAGLDVSAPLGLGGHFENAEIRIGPAHPESIELPLRVAVREPGGRQLASLPIRLTERVQAGRGVTLSGTDLTGVVSAQLRLDLKSERLTLNLSYGPLPEQTPGTLLPVLRFMHHAVAPNSLAFAVGKPDFQDAMPLPEGDAVGEDLLRMVEDLERVQAAAGEVFALPAEMTSADRRELARAARLLDGEQVQLGNALPATITFDDRDKALSEFAAAGTFQLGMVPSDNDGHYIAKICGHALDLGPCHYVIPVAQLAETQPDYTQNAITVAPVGEQALVVALGLLRPPSEYTPGAAVE